MPPKVAKSAPQVEKLVESRKSSVFNFAESDSAGAGGACAAGGGSCATDRTVDTVKVNTAIHKLLKFLTHDDYNKERATLMQAIITTGIFTTGIAAESLTRTFTTESIITGLPKLMQFLGSWCGTRTIDFATSVANNPQTAFNALAAIYIMNEAPAGYAALKKQLADFLDPVELTPAENTLYTQTTNVVCSFFGFFSGIYKNGFNATGFSIKKLFGESFGGRYLLSQASTASTASTASQQLVDALHNDDVVAVADVESVVNSVVNDEELVLEVAGGGDASDSMEFGRPGDTQEALALSPLRFEEEEEGEGDGMVEYEGDGEEGEGEYYSQANSISTFVPPDYDVGANSQRNAQGVGPPVPGPGGSKRKQTKRKHHKKIGGKKSKKQRRSKRRSNKRKTKR